MLSFKRVKLLSFHDSRGKNYAIRCLLAGSMIGSQYEIELCCARPSTFFYRFLNIRRIINSWGVMVDLHGLHRRDAIDDDEEAHTLPIQSVD